jgi:hypothetical protein
MTRIALFSLAVLATLAASCAPRYRAAFNESESPILSGDCPVRVYPQSPDRRFVIVGEVEAENPEKLATDEASFVKAVRERICKHGGNAVIAQQDEQGRYLRGTVIRLH